MSFEEIRLNYKFDNMKCMNETVIVNKTMWNVLRSWRRQWWLIYETPPIIGKQKSKFSSLENMDFSHRWSDDVTM